MSNCDALDRLVCGYTRENRTRKVFVMLKGYQGFADESEGAIASLTACVLPYEHWDAFVTDWAAVLQENPKIKHFHMRESRALDGEFLNWTATARDLKIVRLVSVLMKYKPLVLTAWLVKRDHDRIIGESVGVWETGHWYVPCLFCLLYIAAAYSAVQKQKLPIDFVFDKKGSSLEHIISLWFGEVVSAATPDLRPYFGSSPIFRDDQEMIPLQAADLVGWHIHRKLEIAERDSERAATERLNNLPQRAVQLDESNLKELAAQYFDVANTDELRPFNSLMRLKPSKRRKEVAKLKRRFKRRIEGIYDQIQRSVQAVRQYDGDAVEGSPQGNSGEARCGEARESSKKTEG